MQLKIFT